MELHIFTSVLRFCLVIIRILCNYFAPSKWRFLDLDDYIVFFYKFKFYMTLQANGLNFVGFK